MPTQDVIELDLKDREVIGKTVKKLRREGLVPAVIHDHGKDSIIVMGQYMEVLKAYQQAGKHHPLELKVGGKTYTALIKVAEFDPKKNSLKHVVFNAVKADQKVEAEVPIHIIGDIPAEKTGLMLLTQLDHVEVEALPKNLPDEITVDGSKLVEIGDRVTVADLVIPSGVTILTEAERPIATVEETKAQISAEEEAADEAAAAEQSAAATGAAEEAPAEQE